MSPVWVHLVWAAAPALCDLNFAASLQVSLHGRLVSKRHFGHKLSGALIVKINSDQSRCCAPSLCISSLFLSPFCFLPSPLLALPPPPPSCFSPQITIFPSTSYHCCPSFSFPPSPHAVYLAGSKQAKKCFSFQTSPPSWENLMRSTKMWIVKSKVRTTFCWENLTCLSSLCNIRCDLPSPLWFDGLKIGQSYHSFYKGC